MQFHAVALTHAPSQLLGLEFRLGRHLLLEIAEDFLGQFMSRLGPALARQQPFQALLRKLGLRLIDRGTRQTEVSGGLGQRTVVYLHRPQRFVFELEQVLRIEKGGWLKQWVAHLGGAGIKGAGGLQGLGQAELGSDAGLVGAVAWAVRTFDRD